MRAYLSRTSAPTPVLIRAANGFQIILGKVRPNTSPGREPSTSSDHCSLDDDGPTILEVDLHLQAGELCFSARDGDENRTVRLGLFSLQRGALEAHLLGARGEDDCDIRQLQVLGTSQ